jgi:hypothetical protein
MSNESEFKKKEKDDELTTLNDETTQEKINEFGRE